MSDAKNERRDPEAEAALEEDRRLIAAAIEGDRAAFGELVERYQERVYAVAYGILRNRADAWDLAQEAFVKAYRNLDRFEGRGSFFTWMYRLTYNLSIDHARKRGRRNRDVTSVEEPGRLETAASTETGPTFRTDPGEMSEREELMRVLHEAMGKLTDKQRAVIVLREVEGLAYQEIADVLGIKVGTVMSRLYHARRNLQALLTPYVESGDAVPESLELALGRS